MGGEGRLPPFLINLNDLVNDLRGDQGQVGHDHHDRLLYPRLDNRLNHIWHITIASRLQHIEIPLLSPFSGRGHILRGVDEYLVHQALLQSQDHIIDKRSPE